MLINILSTEVTYGNGSVLENININLQNGHIGGLVGKNGVGKTTLIKAINGEIESPIKIKLDDKNIDQYNTNKIIHIENCLEGYLYLTSLEFINYYLALYNKEMDKILFDELISLCFFENYINSLINELSMGTKQKLIFITIILLKCSLSLMDECLENIDRVSLQNIIKFMKSEFKSKPEKVVIISSHSNELLENLCDFYLEIENKNVVIKSHE